MVSPSPLTMDPHMPHVTVILYLSIGPHAAPLGALAVYGLEIKDDEAHTPPRTLCGPVWLLSESSIVFGEFLPI